MTHSPLDLESSYIVPLCKCVASKALLLVVESPVSCCLWATFLPINNNKGNTPVCQVLF